MCEKFDGAGSDYEAEVCHPRWRVQRPTFETLDASVNDCQAWSRTSEHCECDGEDHAAATTLVILKVPRSYTSKCLRELLDTAGFWGKYDFLDLPPVGRGIKFKKALVNFASTSVAETFRATFHRRDLRLSGQDGLVSVAVSPFQGFAACAERHPAGVVYRDSGMHFLGCEPRVTRPPPGLERVVPRPPIDGLEEQHFGHPRGASRAAPLGGPPGSWCVRMEPPAPIGRLARGMERWSGEQVTRAGVSATGLPRPPRFQENNAWAKVTPQAAHGEVFYFSL